VAIGFAEHVFQPRHQSRWWIVGHEMAHEFSRDEFRGGGRAGDVRQRPLPLRYAAVLVDLAKQALRPRLVRIGIEYESAGGAETAFTAGKSPSGDDPRQRRDVFLRITAGDAERVQLH